jgi:aerobic carbon-monoxide dehydrogenase medium subunit
MKVIRPASLDEAAQFAAEAGAALMAGGCEFKQLLSESQPAALILLGDIPDLLEFDAHPKKGLVIGGSVKLCDIANNLWIAKRWAALHEAAEQLMPPQIRHTGTVVGNLCAGLAHYDMATALIALRARLLIYRHSAFAEIALRDFYLTNGQPDLRPGDIVVKVLAEPPVPDAGSAFRKILKIQRHVNDLPKVSAAAYVALDAKAQTIVDATVAIGCCGASPIRVDTAEKALIGSPAQHSSYAGAGKIAAAAAGSLTEITSLEQTRRRLVEILVRDSIEQAASRARSKHDPFEDARDLV